MSSTAVFHLSDYGHAVEVEVQRKLPPPMRQFLSVEFPKPLYASGPRFATHMSGPDQFETSGRIRLPRPLTRDGTHSYISGGKLIQELDMEELRDRNELYELYCPSYSILIIKLFLQPTAGVSPKRRRAFTASPPGPRRRVDDPPAHAQAPGPR